MADNIYLLETRLSTAQQSAIATVRDLARAKGFTVFLVGGAVRDLLAGTAVRDLDVVVQGSASKLQKELEKAGAAITGEAAAGQAFFLRFPGGVRMEVGSALSATYPKPGKPVLKPATILEDLRRRDFTANAMALSLNEGSYGLLMDPLNGAADIENRELRLVSNYGFIEEPVRMIRAARFMARLGWHMDEKTQARYETGKAEGYISAMNEFHRGYETEEIFHEEDALRVIRRLEDEGWMRFLAPTLLAAHANVAELQRMRESQAQLQIQGVVADAAAANFPLLTAKMDPKEVQALKKGFPRQGFVAEIDSLEARGKEFAAQLGAKGAALPSQAYKLLTSTDPELVLWVAHTTKSAALQAKFRSFYTEWPQVRQRIPYVLMQEMRITSDLPQYEELVENIFFELMNGKLGTPEEMKAYLEPYSPPAPPPPVSLRRPRAPKKESKAAKSRKKATDEGVEAEGDDARVAAGEVESPLATPPAAPVTPANGSGGAKVAAEAPAPSRPNGSKPEVSAILAKAKAGGDPGEKKAVQRAPAKAAAAEPAPAKKGAVKTASAPPPKKAAAKPAAPKKAEAAKKGVPAKKPATGKGAAPAKKAVAGKKGAPVKAAAKKTVPSKGGKTAAKKAAMPVKKGPGKGASAKKPAKRR